MASQYHEVAYDSLLEMIGFESYQKLEEVLISGITSGIISGKMDQERKKFYVTSTIGRDVQLSGMKYNGIYRVNSETTMISELFPDILFWAFFGINMISKF